MGEHVPAPVDPPIPPPSEILSPDFMPSNEEDICHSKKPIQIPLPLADKTRFAANLMNGYYEEKEHFVPEYDPDLVCSCPKENPFFSDDPVEYNYVVPRRSPYLGFANSWTVCKTLLLSDCLQVQEMRL